MITLDPNNVDGEPKKTPPIMQCKVMLLYFHITPDLSVCLQIKSLQKYAMPQDPNRQCQDTPVPG